MMWGHLKAADFINLIEGNELPVKRQAHLRSCARCTEAFVSAQNLHSKLAVSALSDDELPEPDWFQFRADVRNFMLSRAAQRQSKGFSRPGWTGWTSWLTRPAMSWGLAVAFTAGLSAGLLVWNHPAVQPDQSSAAVENDANANSSSQIANLDAGTSSDAADDAAVEPAAMNSSFRAWSQFGVFEEVSQLNDKQAEKLQRLLEADIEQTPARQ